MAVNGYVCAHGTQSRSSIPPQKGAQYPEELSFRQLSASSASLPRGRLPGGRNRIPRMGSTNANDVHHHIADADGESNKQVVRRYVEAFNRGDNDALRALFVDDAVIHGVLGWAPIDEAIPIWRELHSAFAIELTIEDMSAERDVVAVRYTERGRFVGPFRGRQPTGKPYELIAMEWFEFKDGKIRRRWGARDSASQARQIGM